MHRLTHVKPSQPSHELGSVIILSPVGVVGTEASEE